MERLTRGEWIQTYTGQAVEPLHPKLQDIRLEDIAHSLSNLCRYTGHCSTFYSVAQHAIMTSEICESECKILGYGEDVTRRFALLALHHDDSEAYLGDMSRPLARALLRHMGINLEPYHARLRCVIGQALDVVNLDTLPHVVNRSDAIALATEKIKLMGPEPASWGDLPPTRCDLWRDPMLPSVACQRYLQRHHALMCKRERLT